MATGATSLLGLALPVTGELSGTWGTVVNDQLTSLVDSAVAGTTTLSTDADVTLTTASLTANQARQAIILWAPASGTVTRNITAPAQSKVYVVINATGGTQNIVFRGAGPTTGVTLVPGERSLVAWNGTDFVKVSDPTTLVGKTIQDGTFTNGYTEETNVANAPGTGYAIDLTNGTLQILTLTGNCAFTFPTPTAGRSFIMFLKQDATGSRTATWPSSVKWPNSISPTLTTTASKGDKFVFTADGTYWWGSNAGQKYL